MRVLDLCAGAGGASTGLGLGGFPVTVAVDSWPLALETHAANHPQAEHVLGDVRELVGTFGRADVVWASPPCVTFSRLARNRTKDTTVLDAVLRIIEEARPRWWVVENVPEAAEAMHERGLTVRFIKASAFGLPHKRKRAFAGYYAPPLATGIARERFVTITATDGKRTRYAPGWHGRSEKARTWRQPTIPEALERMGFPPGYVIKGGKVASFKQIGNAVCPPVAAAIAAAQHDERAHGPAEVKHLSTPAVAPVPANGGPRA